MNETIVGIFTDSESAQEALSQLERAGFPLSDIGYIAKDAGPSVSRFLPGLAPLAVPGIGPVVAAGPLAAALAGSGARGLSGAIAELGVPEAVGSDWMERVRKGASLVLVPVAAESTAMAEAALSAAGAGEVSTYNKPVAFSGDDPADPRSEPANYGDEGGSSQWSQTVLRVKDGASEVAERSFSRDRKPERLD